MHAHPEGAAYSVPRFAGVEVRVMRTLQGAEGIVVAAKHEG